MGVVAQVAASRSMITGERSCNSCIQELLETRTTRVAPWSLTGRARRATRSPTAADHTRTMAKGRGGGERDEAALPR